MNEEAGKTLGEEFATAAEIEAVPAAKSVRAAKASYRHNTIDDDKRELSRQLHDNWVSTTAFIQRAGEDKMKELESQISYPSHVAFALAAMEYMDNKKRVDAAFGTLVKMLDPDFRKKN